MNLRLALVKIIHYYNDKSNKFYKEIVLGLALDIKDVKGGLEQY